MGRHGEGRARVLEAIKELTKAKGYPPTVREIGDRCKIRSTSTVQFHINSLLDAGILEREPNRGRTLRIKEEK